MTDTDDEKTEDRGIGITEVKSLLESVFKGCHVYTPSSMGASFHAEVSFFEYEIRVILSGKRTKDRSIHYRFMQRVEQPDGKRPTKRMIQDVTVTSREDFEQEVADTKAHLLGTVFAIQKALRPPNVPTISGVDDLFKGKG